MKNQTAFDFVARIYLYLLRQRYALTGKFLGINISMVPVTETGGNQNHVPYQPAYTWHLKRFMKCFDIKSSDKLFDYGSGKGGAMIFFSQYPFSEIGGVEYDENLHHVAENNFKLKGLNHLKSHNGDATTFADIDQYTYFFLFNPFLGEVMELTIEQIRKSLVRNPRKITVLYQNPQEHELFVNSNLFPYVATCFVSSWINVDKYGRRINVYCTEFLDIDFNRYGIEKTL